MNQLWDNPPDFVNELGVKWWRDDTTIRYATKPDPMGTTFEGITAWVIQKPDGYMTRVLTDESGIVFEAQSLEAIGAKIDLMKAMKRFA